MAKALMPSTGMSKYQMMQIEQQKVAEKRRLAEEKSALEKRKAMLRSGQAGRSLLISTSPTGVQPSGQSATATLLGG